MSDVILNFVGKTDELVPAENALETLKQKDREVAEQAKATGVAYEERNKKSVAGNNKLAKSIEDLGKASKSMDKVVIGGAYNQYLVQIQKQLGLTSKELINYIQNARKAAQAAIFSSEDEKEIKELTLTIEVMNDQLKEMGVSEEVVGEKTKSLRTRIKEVKEELVQMADAGKMGTPEFVALKKVAGDLDDQMKDLNTTISNTGSDTKNIDAVISGVSGLAGGYAIAQGAAALFGSENEEVQQALLKVNAAMAILQGLQQVQNVLQKESAFMLGVERVQLSAKAVLTNITTAATAEATIAQRALNVAQAASPIGIILLAVTALVAGYQLLKHETTETQKQQELLNNVNTKAIDNYVEETTRMESLIDRVKKGGLTFKEKQSVLKTYNEKFGETLGIAKDFNEAEQKIINLGPDYIKMLALQAKAHAAFDLAVESSKNAILNQQKGTEDLTGNLDRFKAGFSSWEGFFKSTDNAMDKLADKRRSDNEKQFTDAGDSYLKLNQQYQTEADALKDKLGIKDKDKKEKKAKDGPTENDLLKAAAEERKALLEKQLIDLEKAGQKETQVYIDKKNAIVDIQKDIDSIGVKGVNQRALILAEAEQKAADNQKEFDLKNAENRNELALVNLRNKLSLTLEGGKEETRIKKELLEEQAKQDIKAVQDSVVNAELKAAKIIEIEQKLHDDKQAIDDATATKKLQFDNDIKDLQRAGDILSLQRKLVGEKDKAVIIKINREISELRLQGILQEAKQNEDLFARGKKSKEDYEKEKLAIANKYTDAETGIMNQAFTDREQKAKESLERTTKQLSVLLGMLGRSVEVTLDNGAFKTGLQEVINLYGSFKAIKDSDASDADKKAAMITGGIIATQSVINQSFADASQKRQEEANEELNKIKELKEKELENKNLTEQQKAEIDRRYKEKEKQVRLKAWEAEKDAKKEQALINGALAITNILATVPKFDFGIATAIMIGAAIATTALQVRAIDKAKPPKFKHGKINIQGPGTETSDSIPAMISAGESVIKAKQTRKWEDALHAINNDTFENYLTKNMHDFVFPHIPESVAAGGKEIDYDRLGNVIASKIPEPTYIQNTMDENGMHSFWKKGQNITEFKNERYSMK